MRAALAALFVFLAAPALAGDIRIHGHIDDEMAERAELAVAAGPVRVLIDSGGGSIPAGLRIIRALESSPAPVICEVGETAASMAAVIFESPGCDVRLVRASSTLMFHEASAGGCFVIRQAEAEAIAAELRRLNRVIAAIVAPRVGVTVERFLDDTSDGRELWVFGFNAVALGFADEVLP